MSDKPTRAQTAPARADVATRPARDPFARMRVSDLYWIQLKPMYKGRQVAQPERLARVTVFLDQAAHLEVFRLKVQLDGEPAVEDANHMEVLVDHRQKRVRFAPVKGLRMQPAQRGLGGFLLAQLIEWCQRRYGEYAVAPITLDAGDVGSEEATEIRHRLLSRAGFDISEPDATTHVVHARAGQVDALFSQWNTERVGVLQVTELLRQLREQETVSHKQTLQMTQLQRTIDQFQSNDTGQRFAIGCLIVFAIFQALMLLWVVLS
mgnify:FL=1